MSLVTSSSTRREASRIFSKVGSILGEGAFGVVRLVTCKSDHSKWAVKVIEKSKVDPGDHSLQTEIDILCRVKQPNCICLREWFDEPTRVLLVMELVTGGTLLDHIVNSGHFNEEVGRTIFRDLATGLEYLHAAWDRSSGLETRELYAQLQVARRECQTGRLRSVEDLYRSSRR